MTPPTPTVFIVDDDASVCRSLARLLRHAGFEARTFGSAEEFLRAAMETASHPACLVLDLQMPGLNGLELQHQIAASPSACPVIFISGHGSIPASVQAMRQGAVTFLTKPFDATDLLQAVHEALAQHRQQLEAGARVRAVAARVQELTDREREVMAWVITGALNKQIAARLGIVEKTVKVHRARVLEKMQAASVADLVRLCALAGVEAAR
jgi:FixJ family two-component response regulator